MVQSPWEASSGSSNQEILHILWNIWVHYFINKNLSMILILSQMNLVQASLPYFFKIHFNIILHLHLGRLSTSQLASELLM
jgi:hypothetical protein